MNDRFSEGTKWLITMLHSAVSHCFMPESVWAQVMVGGTNQASDLSKMRNAPPDILVATPGRLNDNMSNAAVCMALGGIRTLIFDEADRLLDMGFR